MNRDQSTAPLLIGPEALDGLIREGACRVVDCRFNLLDPAAGRAAWLEGHVPGAVHADLDRDLAAPVSAATGRHPLPESERFADFLGRIGWRPGLRTRLATR